MPLKIINLFLFSITYVLTQLHFNYINTFLSVVQVEKWMLWVWCKSLQLIMHAKSSQMLHDN